MKIIEITEVKDTCTCDCNCGKPVCESCGKPHAKKDIKETMTSGGTGASSIAVSPVAGGTMQKRNPNGTAKNALDSDTNLLGSKKKPKKNKKD